MTTRLSIALFCGFAFVAARAEVRPAALFSEHMVLQSGASVPVWGTANPGEKVTVFLNGQQRTAVTGADDKWMVRLKNLRPGGPYQMTVSGKNLILIKDVMIGEVWLASGQSNMAFTVSKAHASYAGMLNEEQEIAAANYPQVRMFTGKTQKAYEPQAEIKGEWLLCSPATVGDFSAVAYLFARNLNKSLKVPVGMLTMAFGASTAEAWVPREAITVDPQLRPLLDKFDARESYFKEHPGAMDASAPPAPQTLNARSGKPGKLNDPVQDQHQPTVLYNGMIHPVIPYAIRGAIWYQGESIVGGKAGVMLYPHVMETMVTEWRNRWGEGNFPFYVVQLAALKNVSNNPMVREQQAAILKLPNTGMVVTLDVGDPTNVHPKDKEPVGDRLSRIAMANVYRQKVEYTGPLYASMSVRGDSITLKFTHAEGLTAKSGSLKWFQIAGADEKFVDAEAMVQGSTVMVRSNQVNTPVAVRYAWDNYPEGANLVNGAGLPAAPFRTDQWDALTPIAAEFTGK